jgi:hypothetical protein
MLPTATGRAAGSRLVSAVLVLLVVLGGVFISAETDALPSGLQSTAHRLFGAPGPTVFRQRTHRHRPAAEVIASPLPAAVAPAQSISELCTAYARAPEPARAAELGLKYRPLVIAAGGNAKVAPFCALLTRIR